MTKAASCMEAAFLLAMRRFQTRIGVQREFAEQLQPDAWAGADRKKSV